MRDFKKSRTRGHRNAVANTERYRLSYALPGQPVVSEEIEGKHLATYRYETLKEQGVQVKKTKLS